MLGRGFRRLLANVVIVPDTRTKYVYITDVKRLEIKFKNIYRKEKEREQKVTLQFLFKKIEYIEGELLIKFCSILFDGEK